MKLRLQISLEILLKFSWMFHQHFIENLIKKFANKSHWDLHCKFAMYMYSGGLQLMSCMIYLYTLQMIGKEIQR